MSVDEAARQTLMAQSWPGNIRELRNTIERAAIVCDGELIRPEHLPVPVPAARANWRDAESPNSVAFTIGTSLDEVEKGVILRTLAAHGNNKTLTAQILGISLKTLHNKLRRYAS